MGREILDIKLIQVGLNMKEIFRERTIHHGSHLFFKCGFIARKFITLRKCAGGSGISRVWWHLKDRFQIITPWWVELGIAYGRKLGGFVTVVKLDFLIELGF